MFLTPSAFRSKILAPLQSYDPRKTAWQEEARVPVNSRRVVVSHKNLFDERQ